MFLKYIQSDQERTGARQDYGSAQVRMPQIFLLAGDFTAEETALLENSLRQHFPAEQYAFWLCMGNASVASAHVSRFALPAVQGDFWRKREAYSAAAQGEAFRSFCEQSAAEVFNATAALNCQEPGCISAALICRADQPFSGMLTAAETYRECLQNHFTMVSMDLYLLLDQSAFTEERQQREASVCRSLLEAERMMREHTLRLAYVLSSVDSSGRLYDSGRVLREQYTSIALMVCMKNLISNSPLHRYADRAYGQAVAGFAAERAMEAGLLSSIGHMHLSTDEEFRRLVVYLAVWKRLAGASGRLDAGQLLQDAGLEKEQLRQQFLASFRMRELSKADFETIARDRASDPQVIYTMSSGQAVSRFFGRNLALYAELNMQGSDRSRQLGDWKDLLERRLRSLPAHITNRDICTLLDLLEDTLEELIRDSDALVENRRQKLSVWEGTVFAANERAMRKENPLFLLAAGYIRKLQELSLAEMQREICAKLLNLVRTIASCYRSFQKLAEDTVESLQAAIRDRERLARNPGNGLGRLQTANAEAFYTDRTGRLLEEDCPEEFGRMMQEMRELVAGGEAAEERVYQKLLAFCSRQVFTDPLFRMDFLHELQHRLKGCQDGGQEIRTDTDVSNFLLMAIVDAQHTLFYDSVFQGSQSYTEMCLFLQNDAIFNETINPDAHAANIIRESKMRLFCDKDSDTLDVVFVAGNLKPQTIHRWKNYEAACQQLMENAENARV